MRFRQTGRRSRQAAFQAASSFAGAAGERACSRLLFDDIDEYEHASAAIGFAQHFTPPKRAAGRDAFSITAMAPSYAAFR